MGELIIIRRDSVICLRLILILALIPRFLFSSFSLSAFYPVSFHVSWPEQDILRRKLPCTTTTTGSPFNIPTGITHGSLIIPYPSRKEINYILNGVYGA